MKFWNFVKNSADPEKVELRISGDIVDDGDAWIYEWFGISCASPNTFRDALAQHAGQNIAVWIDSDGGDVFAATGIYNALMEHKNTGSKITTIGDGRVMSAATTIFMSGDERKMSPGCVFMMHNPLTKAYGYAKDLRKAADVLDVVKDCIINAYQLTTGLSRNKISSMMDDETYMSAKTAIKNRFATEMLYAQPENSDQTLESAMNFSFNRLAIQNAANTSMKKFIEFAQKVNENQPNNEEEIRVEIKSVDDLRKMYPDLANQLMKDAVDSDRKRMAELDDLDDPQNNAVHEIINDAKINGKSAGEVKTIVDIVKKHSPSAADTKNAQEQFLNSLNDNKSSGVDGIQSGHDHNNDGDKQEAASAINFMKGVINKKNGVNQ